MRRGPETEESDSLSALHPSHPETAKTNDTGTQKRGSVQIVERAGKGKDKISPGNYIFSIPAVYRVTSEGGRIT